MRTKIGMDRIPFHFFLIGHGIFYLKNLYLQVLQLLKLYPVPFMHPVNQKPLGSDLRYLKKTIRQGRYFLYVNRTPLSRNVKKI